MTRRNPAPPGLAQRLRFRSGLLLTLSAVAGYVDVLAFTRFDRVFVANMTGNAVLLGVSLVEGNSNGVWACLLAALGFAAGVAVGTRMTYGSRGATSLRAAFGLEAVLLAGLGVGWALLGDAASYPALRFGLIVVAAGTMGLQSAAARHLDVLGITTTYITGTLTRLATLLVGQVSSAEAPTEPSSAHRPSPDAAILAGTLAIYVGGAAAAAGMLRVTKEWAVALPVTVLIVVTAVRKRWLLPEHAP